MTITANEIAEALLEIKAIQIRPDEPFTWASGWKSPIYCDNRLSLSFPEVRDLVKTRLIDAICENFADVETIAGVATAGIPQSALVADAMNLPLIYVRSKPKGHGMENMIEGKVPQGAKVVVIEDLISTGGSSLKAVEALKAAGYEVLGLVAIFTYGFPQAEEAFAKAGVKTAILSNYPALLSIAQEMQLISEEQVDTLKKWREAPDQWQG